jgi:hypothetical protein
LINKTTREEKVYIRLENQPGRIQMIGKNEITIPVEGQSAASFFVVLPITEIKNRKTPIHLQISQMGKVIVEKTTNFLGPLGDEHSEK